ncbi:Uncharacterized protein FKW44_020811, partial [Caligus rogercresseyi]
LDDRFQPGPERRPGLDKVLPVHTCHCHHNGGRHRNNTVVSALVGFPLQDAPLVVVQRVAVRRARGPYLLLPEHGQI